MSADYHAIAKEHWDAQPSPHAAGLTNAEFPVAVRLATMAKFGGHASPEEAKLFWEEFKGLGMSPQDFEHALDRLAPLSFAYHGRPPSMAEIGQLREADPKKARSYFADLPDQHHPHVSAGEMVKAMQSAAPHFREHLGRQPTKTEGAYLVHSGESALEFARRLSTVDGSPQQNDGLSAETGRDGGIRSPSPPRGQSFDQ